MVYVLSWWLIAQILGWAALPIAYRTLRWLPDRGYAFSKPLGLLLASYILWLSASTGFLRNETGGILAAILLLAAVSAWIFFRGKEREAGAIRQSLPAFLRQNARLVWSVEILFAAGLAAWAILRAYAVFKIMPAGGEKFMEMAFMNGILNSPQFPPLDPWLSGFAISYYYFGYVMMALMTRLSAAPPGVGFDLYDALLFAMTLAGVFGVVYNLVAIGLSQRPEPTASRTASRPAIRYGFLGALLVVVMGNLEGLLEALYARGILPASFWNWIDIPGLVGNPVTGTFFPRMTDLWWWRASRVIQDRNLVNDPLGISPITEFPFFSFLLGDNHPHVLALPFVLLAIALALNLLRRQVEIPRSWQAERMGAPWWNPISASLDNEKGLFFLYALSLGALGFLNTWDMPIYIGLVTLAYGIGEYAAHRRMDWHLVRRTLLLGTGFLLAGVLLYLLFYIGFGSQAGGILPYVFPPTRLPQYLVMFGAFIFILAWFLPAYLIAQTRQAGGKNPIRLILRWWAWVILACVAVFVLVLAIVLMGSLARQVMAGGVLDDPALLSALGGLGWVEALQAVILSRLLNPWLFLLLSLLLALAALNIGRQVRQSEEQLAAPGADIAPGAGAACISASDLFAFLLAFIGLALTLSVEFFYLRDQFGVRMNTVFKFYYQGWIMLGCASAYGIWWLLNPGVIATGRIARNVFLLGCSLLVAAGMVYPLLASYSRVAGFQSEPDLDGTAHLANNNPDDWAAIDWLRVNVQGTAVILEAPGKSYDYEGRVSAFSGHPAVLGWALHENQWRGNYDEQGKREPDIETIYTTSDPQLALDLLHKWQVRYVIVGATEQNYIQRMCAEPNRVCNLSRALRKFDALLAPVFQQGEMTIYEVPGG